MRFEPPLEPATLVRRYKRFLSDVILADGREVTAHCANPGAMLGLDAPGSRIWVQPATNPKRKLRYSWLLVEAEGGGMAGIDTSLPNRLVKAALADRAIPELLPYDVVRPEQKYGKASRIDFLLEGGGAPQAYVEVKNVHLMRQSGLAEFPDCVTARGAKHLAELADMAEAGHRAVMLYLVQRTDCDRFDLARDLDPAYAAAFDAARARGVEVLVYGSAISPEGITLSKRLPFSAAPG